MKETKKNILILIIFSIASIGSYFYLFFNIKQMSGAVSSELAQIKLEMNKDERLKSVKILMDKTKDQRSKLSGVFVQPEGSVDFIEMIESFGKVAGVKIEIGSVGIDAIKSKMGSSTESFRLSVKAEGSWANTIHLLRLFESMPFSVSFNNVSLNKSSGESAPAKSKEKEQPISSYWTGNFDFSVLKVKGSAQPAKIN